MLSIRFKERRKEEEEKKEEKEDTYKRYLLRLSHLDTCPSSSILSFRPEFRGTCRNLDYPSL